MHAQIRLIEIIDEASEKLQEICAVNAEFLMKENIYGSISHEVVQEVNALGERILVEIGADEKFDAGSIRVIIRDQNYHFGMFSFSGTSAHFQLRCLERYLLEITCF